VTLQCPRCRSENTDSSKYCSTCSAPLLGDDRPSSTPTRTVEGLSKVLSPGTIVAGKYRILEGIGHGGMGVVCKAEDIKLQRTVALKFLSSRLADSTEFKERFLVEARAAAALSHPNICVIHEIVEDQYGSCIVMEYVEGRTLRDRMREGPLGTEQIAEIVAQVAAGLEDAHHEGIIHRDIKAANVMLTDKGQAKIISPAMHRSFGHRARTLTISMKTRCLCPSS
jgi:serine/threonine protein kinase